MPPLTMHRQWRRTLARPSCAKIGAPEAMVPCTPAAGERRSRRLLNDAAVLRNLRALAAENGVPFELRVGVRRHTRKQPVGLSDRLDLTAAVRNQTSEFVCRPVTAALCTPEAPKLLSSD